MVPGQSDSEGPIEVTWSSAIVQIGTLWESIWECWSWGQHRGIPPLLQWRPSGPERVSDLPQPAQSSWLEPGLALGHLPFHPGILLLPPDPPTLLNSYTLFQAGSSVRPRRPITGCTHHCPAVRVSWPWALRGWGPGPLPHLQCQGPGLQCGGRPSCWAFLIINLRARGPGLVNRPRGPRPSHSSPLLITNWGDQGHTLPRRGCSAGPAASSGSLWGLG